MGPVGHRHVLAGLDMSPQPVEVPAFPGDCGAEVEAIVGQARDRQLGLEVAGRGRQVRELHPTAPGRRRIGGNPVEKARRVASGDLELGERRQVKQPRRVANRDALVGDRVVPGLAAPAVAVDRLHSVAGEPARALVSVHVPELGNSRDPCESGTASPARIASDGMRMSAASGLAPGAQNERRQGWSEPAAMCSRYCR